MILKLYDLAGAESDRRFSAPCWRVKMALQHKGLEVETIPWRFTEKEAIAFSQQKNVPVLVDGYQTVVDSWEIARYLDATYSDRPSLLGGAIGESEALFIKFWSEQTIAPIVLRIILPDLFRHLHEKDKTYFRETREARLGMTLEEFAAPTVETITNLRHALTPVRKTLQQKPYLGGNAPCFADYILFGYFQWARAVCPIPLLSPDDAVYQWRDRLLNAFDHYASNAKGYPV